MNEETKKAYRLVELDLRRRATTMRIELYDTSFNSVRAEIDGKIVWSSSISQAILDLENEP